MRNRGYFQELFVVVAVSLFLLSAVLTRVGLSQKLPEMTPKQMDEAKKIYDRGCSRCHGPNGDGKGDELSRKYKVPPCDFTKPLSQWNYSKGDVKKVFEAITNGVPGTTMAKVHYSEEERWALTYFVVKFAKEKP